MRKINFILFLVIFSAGCSVIRNDGNKKYGATEGIITERLFENIKKQNITTSNFFIQKIEIEISTPGNKDKILGSLKFESPDKYLFSLKSRAGIEASRIFISEDTILINDRINRKQYYGSPRYLKTKFGLAESILPVIFGDYVNDNLSDSQTKCSAGKLNSTCTISGMKINYVIDCKKEKTISAITEDNFNAEVMEIHYKDFFNAGDIIIAGRIEIKDLKRKTTIKIRIRKIESPWSGNIEFIPGNKYELIQLL
ncbi:MAG: DUF4292 domain-containing protein [Bacteroidia bacterium]|nr:DUF4292 domain-containing protein [Bacteroidia bacterium]